MPRFRKKPVIISAIRNDGEWRPIAEWLQKLIAPEGGPLFQLGESPPMTHCSDGTLLIYTREGVMRADVGDWVIRGIKGEFYPCKPDIFAATYDPVE